MLYDQASVGPVERYFLKSGKSKFRIEIAHNGLNKHKVIKGDFQEVVTRKADVQLAAWDVQWQKKKERQAQARRKEANLQLAEERTAEAEAELERLRSILEATLDVDDTIDWDSLKDDSSFPEPHLGDPQLPDQPIAPDPKDYDPDLRFYHHLIPPWKRSVQARAEERLARAKQEWRRRSEEHEAESKKLAEIHAAAKQAWEARKAEFEAEQQEANAAIEREKLKYFDAEPEAVVEYCDLVLSRSDYPDSFPQEFELYYNDSNATLVIDYQLPAPEDLPTLKEVKYIKTKDEMREKHLTDRQLNQLYDDVLYQVALRTIHEVYEADQVDALQAVVFNGFVHTIDDATGKEIEPCLLSLQAEREEFDDINLSNVDPKKCFKALKGVGSSKLHSVTPVAPIVKVNKEDSRFIESEEVASGLSEATNLAAISWEEFEHLVREVFEHEFRENGGEVKVTHASRDGGVDAIAFDPDPIRGGKIVIQAKRYTNTVGVTAVRDLFGTVMNEGATKGILVTTSDYGPDAYKFAKDKPLTLLNGGNLLHLLQKHGHRAKIDLKEAKKLNADR